MIKLLYKRLCPNCGGDICADRLNAGIMCKRCMPKEEAVCDVLKEGEFLYICEVEQKSKAFEHFFKEKNGFSLRQIQKSWAKRFFLGYSFALLAPTGVGKTTFGLTLSSFLKQKSYLLFPTQLLVNQAVEKLRLFGLKPLFYDSSLSKGRKDEIKEKIFSGDFQILITTTAFFYKNFDSIPKKFGFVFIDDVDSVLKSAKNIDKVMLLLGFNSQDINDAMRFIELKIKGSLSYEEFEAWQEKISLIRLRSKAKLIVSSATANPKSMRVKLFGELLGFEVGRPIITVRNVEDLYENSNDLWQRSIELINRFGKGGLVFLPANESKEKLKEYVKFLNQNKIRAQSYEDFEKEAFLKGEVKVLVGFASYRNPLARGIDMPQIIRYALFVGVPKLEFTLDIKKHTTLYLFLLSLLPLLKNESFFAKLTQNLNYLKHLLKIPYKRLNESVKKRIDSIYNEIVSVLDKEKIEWINQNPDISVFRENDSFKFVVADVTGYIQASGRTSRLYVGGLSKGLSYLLVDNKKAFFSLQKKVRWFSEEIYFKKAHEVDIDSLLREIDEDRRKIALAILGEVEEENDLFTTSLIIVESPNKAKTLANFYGKPIVRDIKGVKVYEVAKEGKILSIVASKGHVVDLNKKEGIYGVLYNERFIPVFEPIDLNRKGIIEVLRRLGVEVKEIFIAMDPDVEGEKISYDLELLIKAYNKKIYRAEFHEVTKRAFDEALKNPRGFNEELVKAQLVRRIADRWIGFGISQLLQKKMQKSWLSAGRVQSAVLEWIVLREREAKNKVYVTRVFLEGFEIEFVFENREEAKDFFDNLAQIEVKFVKMEEKELLKTPFTTDSMLFTAANELRFSPQKTMQLAQNLFELGFITYHRTDSIRISAVGIQIAKEYIVNRFGEEYFKPRRYEESGGAHEAIHPTKAMDMEELRQFLQIKNISLNEGHLRLYDLIFRNFIASQMRPAVVKDVTAMVKGLDKETKIHFYLEIIRHGINLITKVQVHDIKEGFYMAKKHFLSRSKVLRFTYAQIIHMMKKKGIGRPSTYAITIEKLQERHYIIQRRGFLYATKLGQDVYEILRNDSKLYTFVNEKYTKELEELMDEVKEGKKDYEKVIANLYRAVEKSIFS